MKTIILCGGQGTRLREETEFKPKPMVQIGGIPILLHIMNIYAAYGHKEFVLCLGYKGELIREYFLNLAHYSNDFRLDMADRSTKWLVRHVDLDYRIYFIETGQNTESGERVKIAAQHVPDDQFMVTYGDGVSDVPIDKLLAHHRRQAERYGTCATITVAYPSSKYGQVIADRRNVVHTFVEKPRLKEYINGGFMAFDRAALRYLRKGEALERGLERMTGKARLSQFRHEGFWQGMDTMKDVLYLNKVWEEKRPWVHKK